MPAKCDPAFPLLHIDTFCVSIHGLINFSLKRSLKSVEEHKNFCLPESLNRTFFFLDEQMAWEDHFGDLYLTVPHMVEVCNLVFFY